MQILGQWMHCTEDLLPFPDQQSYLSSQYVENRSEYGCRRNQILHLQIQYQQRAVVRSYRNYAKEMDHCLLPETYYRENRVELVAAKWNAQRGSGCRSFTPVKKNGV